MIASNAAPRQVRRELPRTAGSRENERSDVKRAVSVERCPFRRRSGTACMMLASFSQEETTAQRMLSAACSEHK